MSLIELYPAPKRQLFESLRGDRVIRLGVWLRQEERAGSDRIQFQQFGIGAEEAARDLLGSAFELDIPLGRRFNPLFGPGRWRRGRHFGRLLLSPRGKRIKRENQRGGE